MQEIKLSVLIPVHTNHIPLFNVLYDNLKKQIAQENANDLVEVLYHVDSGEISTGAKRNGLLDKAQGDYVIFPDADDEIPPYYIKELLEASKSNSDCFGINGKMTTDGYNEVKWDLSKDNLNMTIYIDGKPYYKRTTNHITAVKRGLALMARFPDLKLGEDKGYSDKVVKFLKTEHKIIPLMYHYKYTSKNKLY